jgi:hypothetical protein
MAAWGQYREAIKLMSTESKPLGISELVRLIGDENIEVQNLANNARNFNQRKGYSDITFSTSPENGQQVAQFMMGKKPDKVALVIWFPRNKLPEGMQ